MSDFMSFDKTRWVWHNGKIVPWSDATVHISAKVVQYGAGVFEGIRCYETQEGPAIFRLKEHLDRFHASAAQYGMEIPFTRAALVEAICETILRNGFTSCYIRPTCSYGSGRPGLRAEGCPLDVGILTWTADPLMGAEGLKSGVRATVSKWTKFHFRMMPTTAKAAGGYINSMLAVREAIARGYDEAILLNAEGNIAEGSVENIFIVQQGRLLTNDENSSILLGITRDSVIQIARDLGYPVEIRDLQLSDLLTASEAFFTGTAADLLPIREVDGTTIGSGEPGPVSKNLQQVFFRITSGRELRYRQWLHFVPAAAKAVGE